MGYTKVGELAQCAIETLFVKGNCYKWSKLLSVTVTIHIGFQ